MNRENVGLLLTVLLLTGSSVVEAELLFKKRDIWGILGK